MNNSDEMKFIEALTGLGLIFDKEISKPLARAYFYALKDLTIEQVGYASNKHTKTGRFFPKPSELIDMVKPSKDDQSAIAWGNVILAIGKFGAYRQPTFKDKAVIDSIKAVGGWANLCAMSYKDLEFKRREFITYHSATNPTSDKQLLSDAKSTHYLDNNNK